VLEQISKDCKQLKLPTQICGEMAADPLAVLLLIGMGFFDLSMNLRSLSKVKRVISRFTLSEMQQLLQEVKEFENAATVKNHLIQALEAKELAGLIRAGS
jgi:phosphotransferase system enzyme I (PtsP)